MKDDVVVIDNYGTCNVSVKIDGIKIFTAEPCLEEHLADYFVLQFAELDDMGTVLKQIFLITVIY